MTKATYSIQESEDLCLALGMRICFIETGTPVLRANDAIAQGNLSLIKPLTSDQQKLIVRLDELRKKVMQETNPCRHIAL